MDAALFTEMEGIIDELHSNYGTFHQWGGPIDIALLCYRCGLFFILFRKNHFSLLPIDCSDIS